MKLLGLQRWSGLVLLAALIVSTHFTNAGSSHLRAELILVLLVATAVVHATASFYVVATDYTKRPRARALIAAFAIAIGAIGLGASWHGVATATRAVDTPGHIEGSRCSVCHTTHSFRLDLHPGLGCASCHDVRSGRSHLSSFDAPLEDAMANRSECVSCHASPPAAPLASSVASSVSPTAPPVKLALSALTRAALPEDLDTLPWSDAAPVRLPREGSASSLELRAIATSESIALRATFDTADSGKIEWLAVLGAVDASPVFEKMGCATSCHQDEKHRTSRPDEKLFALLAAPEGGKPIDIDAKGMHPSSRKARIERRVRGTQVTVDLVFARAAVDLRRGVSVALFDGSKSHALRPRPLSIMFGE